MAEERAAEDAASDHVFSTPKQRHHKEGNKLVSIPKTPDTNAIAADLCLISPALPSVTGGTCWGPVATPPTPDTTGIPPDRPLPFRTSLSLKRPLAPSNERKEDRASLLGRVLAACDFPASLCLQVEALGVLGQQLLYAPLKRVAASLSQISQVPCLMNAELEEVVELKETLLHSAVSHIQSAYLTHAQSIELPPLVSSLVDRIVKLSDEIIRRGFQSGSSQLTAADSSEGAWVDDTAKQASSHPPSDPAPDPLDDNPPLPSSLRAPLDPDLFQVICLESVVALRDLIEAPLTQTRLGRTLLEKYAPEGGEAGDQIPSRVPYLDPGVGCRAQKSLGKIWKRLQKTGIADLSSVKEGTGAINGVSPPPSTSPPKHSKTKAFGILKMMGARAPRRGKYRSAKAIAGKTKRTREKNRARKAVEQAPDSAAAT